MQHLKWSIEFQPICTRICTLSQHNDIITQIRFNNNEFQYLVETKFKLCYTLSSSCVQVGRSTIYTLQVN